ncbi:hypothetical protein IAG44_24635 [Streptomyces roseirectus]|uniref:Integral membrane protein n=1 Tax=Streptomyces roseirectus TaxID=2768066 RepID=A0A7H0IHM3_9ACTN|nr:hypothetical protein [Streptomyces roseirectus]QNP72289.1 hypothetical protein IAG44_24635 [Streptomyces roseirectus]
MTAGRDTELKKELDATLHARRELGEEYDSALVESFLEKVDQRIDGAVERRVRRQFAEQQMSAARDARTPGPADSWGERFGFGIVSLVLAIPLSAIAVVNADLPGLFVAWAGIVGVNAVHAFRGSPGLVEALLSRRRGKSRKDDRWED